MSVDGALADTGPGCDRLDGECPVADIAELVERRLEDHAPGPFDARVLRRVHHVPHSVGCATPAGTIASSSSNASSVGVVDDLLADVVLRSASPAEHQHRQGGSGDDGDRDDARDVERIGERRGGAGMDSGGTGDGAGDASGATDRVLRRATVPSS